MCITNNFAKFETRGDKIFQTKKSRKIFAISCGDKLFNKESSTHKEPCIQNCM